MENTLENKAKFFAQHWGQRVALKNESISSRLYQMDRVVILHCETHTLELKPLSSISDEDAIEVAKILCSKIISEKDILRVAKKSEKGRNRVDKIVYIGCKTHTNYILTVEELKVIANFNGCVEVKDNGTLSNAVDFLRSRGYALPWMWLSVEQQIEYGWVKLKGETK